jgi:predicted DNA-binding transcriptional regulator AlpA
MQTRVVDPSPHVTLPELAELRRLRLSWLYERSRRDALPGQRRLGRHVRVVLSEFDRGVQEGLLAAR